MKSVFAVIAVMAVLMTGFWGVDKPESKDCAGDCVESCSDACPNDNECYNNCLNDCLEGCDLPDVPEPPAPSPGESSE